MEWATIDHDGTMIMATNFLNGVLIDYNTQITFVPGYEVQDSGDMDGPQLRPRKQTQTVELRLMGEVGG